MQLVPSSLTRNGIQAPWTGRAESQPLDRQGIPPEQFWLQYFNRLKLRWEQAFYLFHLLSSGLSHILDMS